MEENCIFRGSEGLKDKWIRQRRLARELKHNVGLLRPCNSNTFFHIYLYIIDGFTDCFVTIMCVAFLLFYFNNFLVLNRVSFTSKSV